MRQPTPQRTTLAYYQYCTSENQNGRIRCNTATPTETCAVRLDLFRCRPAMNRVAVPPSAPCPLRCLAARFQQAKHNRCHDVHRTQYKRGRHGVAPQGSSQPMCASRLTSDPLPLLALSQQPPSNSSMPASLRPGSPLASSCKSGSYGNARVPEPKASNAKQLCAAAARRLHMRVSDAHTKQPAVDPLRCVAPRQRCPPCHSGVLQWAVRAMQCDAGLGVAQWPSPALLAVPPSCTHGPPTTQRSPLPGHSCTVLRPPLPLH
jgi:hypothetical protein